MAQGLLNPSGRLKWESEFKQYSDGSSDLSLYGDYRFTFTGPLANYNVGFYNLDLTYRDYIKSETTQPTVTTYNLSTDLFPQSFFSLGLGFGKNRTKYDITEDADEENEVIDELIDTTTKHQSVNFSTPLPFGLRFSYSLNNSHQFDTLKEEVNNEDNTQRINLNKTINFGQFMTSSLNTSYLETTSKDLIENNKTINESKNISFSNTLHTSPLSLTDVDGNYSIRDTSDERDIEYSLNATWKPLESLSIRTSQSKSIDKKKIAGSFKRQGSTINSDINFSVTPYSILSFSGGISRSTDKSNGLIDSRSLSGNFGFHLSYLDNFPLNFNLSKGIDKDFDDTAANKEKSKYESTSIGLNSNMHFGNFTVNSGYNQSSSQEIKVTGEDKEVDNKSLNMGVSYRKNLTRKLIFTGRTNFESDLETFEYNPNYDLSLRYLPMSNLRLKFNLNGYQQDKEVNAKGDIEQDKENYLRWGTNISYSRRQLRLNLDLKQRNDKVEDEKETTVTLNSTYYYRAIELNLKTKWSQIDTKDSKPQDDLEVTTSLIRRF